APRGENRRAWLYRIRPSVIHRPFALYTHPTFLTPPFEKSAPNPLRWAPLPAPKKPVDMIDGMTTMAGGGDFSAWQGLAVHRYAATLSMERRFFRNDDGEMLFVPEAGGLVLRTEMGVMDVMPGEIAVIPRGVAFAA